MESLSGETTIAKRRPTKRAVPESELEESFYRIIQDYKLPTPKLQHIFHPVRQWRFDFCWLDKQVAVEIQGFGPGHNSLPGMTNDYQKHNAALLLGWKVLYFMAHDLVPKNIPETVSTLTSLLGITNGYKPKHSWSDLIDIARRELHKGPDS